MNYYIDRKTIDDLQKTPGRVLEIVVKEEEQEHDRFDTCWCKPVLAFADPKTMNEIWIHNRRH